MRTLFLVTAAIAGLGLLGAAAFNPDRGFLVDSEPLWRMFGVAAYVGGFALPVVAVVAAGRVALRWVAGLTSRSRHV